MENLPKTIDEVINELENIINDTLKEPNYLGIFAYVYKRTTIEIKKAILDKEFIANDDMEAFDVLFANLYIKAYWDYKSNTTISTCWKASFDAKNEKITILQHLFMGMNAHISYDLGLAAATFSDNLENLEASKEDFMKVNDILKRLINEMQDKISKVSPLLFLLDWLGLKNDEKFADFGIIQARNQAWFFANSLKKAENIDAHEEVKTIQDELVSKTSQWIHRPKSFWIRQVISFIARFEEKKISTIIAKLKEN